ncbi:sugar kinase [Alteromonas pelagimontana]|uniref:Sugar kinase n=1 Tax=Alteromonas pelagimontana TaxID=1858656 RepID=A0A6M4MFZ2_9ALTE|nr:sugar kinase [Alteromonas pelagimontana]QJR81116.1 sugar kinase [Alteromonas pelagimontana]
MKKMVIFGECMVELVNRDQENLAKSFAGDTYNTAVYLKRCAKNISVQYFTAIGADFLSDEFLFRMGEEEIGTDYVYRCRARNLGLYMVRTDKHGERTFAYWRNGSAATQTLNTMTGKLVDVDMFYFSGISLAILDDAQREKLFVILDELKSQGCRIVFDPNYRERLWMNPEEARKWTDRAYSMADIAFPGGDDHLTLYGHTDTDAIFAHLAPFDIGEVVVKNGAIGVHVLQENAHYIVPVERVEKVVDTTAAGDAFNGGYLASRLSGGSITDAASFGAKVAATVISYPGAIMTKEAFFSHIAPQSA